MIEPTIFGPFSCPHIGIDQSLPCAAGCHSFWKEGGFRGHDQPCAYGVVGCTAMFDRDGCNCYPKGIA